jgi:hypothetical protein
MIKDHRLDGPDHLDDIVPEAADRSELARLYPDIPEEKRPLLISDEQRHALLDETLTVARQGLRRQTFRLTGYFMSPFALALLIALLVMSFIPREGTPTGNVLSFVSVTVGLMALWIVISKWAFSRFIDVIGMAGVRGDLVLWLTIAIVAVITGLSWWGATLINNLFIGIVLVGGALCISTFIAVKILIALATRGRVTTGQEG